MPTRTILITPSILSADLAHLQDEVSSIEKNADWLQIDVMDGHFVPNLSFGAPVVACLKTWLPLDVHLMVTNPAARIAEFLKLKVTHITFHAEAVPGAAERRALIADIHSGGATAGIAINPGTSVSEIANIAGECDLVLVMSVHPGFGGQSFMPEVLGKIEALRAAYPDLMIQVDGGIDPTTAALCRKAGADNLVAGSSIFRAQDRVAAIAHLRG